MLYFAPENHQYLSLDATDLIDWISVTTLVGFFKEHFDAIKQSEKSAKNPKSKWYRMPPALIRQIWQAETDRSTTLGSWYHDHEEKKLLAHPLGVSVFGSSFLWDIEQPAVLPVFKPQYNSEGYKVAPVQKLVPGIYPEHLIYLKSAGVCGQSDRVEVTLDNRVHILDYKTNKEIKMQGYVNWEGVVSKMQTPVQHLDECHYNHYALQLSLYMYFILRQNRQLKPGSLRINHVQFEEAGQDKYGYPITRLDAQNQPIVRTVTPLELPYLQSEVQSLLLYLQENRGKLTSKRK